VQTNIFSAWIWKFSEQSGIRTLIAPRHWHGRKNGGGQRRLEEKYQRVRGNMKIEVDPGVHQKTQTGY
jgi:hypothetical protein